MLFAFDHGESKAFQRGDLFGLRLPVFDRVADVPAQLGTLTGLLVAGEDRLAQRLSAAEGIGGEIVVFAPDQLQQKIPDLVAADFINGGFLQHGIESFRVQVRLCRRAPFIRR